MSSEPFISRAPYRIIRSAAPVRILDNGGWTDTWFARHGRVVNVAVAPYATVQIEVCPQSGAAPVILNVENYGEEYGFTPGGGGRGRHPMLEAAIEHAGIPAGSDLRITMFCEVPTGASTGTSAAMLVALLGALYRLRGESFTPGRVAYAAHHVEMDILHRQCGVQDQLASAHGGISDIVITEFPKSEVTPLVPSRDFLWELEARIALIYLGSSHDSAEMHAQVIRKLEQEGPECGQLEDLRASAAHARDAIVAEDVRLFGKAMTENTDAQGRLLAGLIGSDARVVIAIARSHGAAGWKVNGAGGEGGTVTILSDARLDVRRRMIREIETSNPRYKNIPVSLSASGLRVWEP